MTIDNPILQSAYQTMTVRTGDGRVIPLNAQIGQAEAEALYATVRRISPERAIEVGMAQGLSTLAILTAMNDNGRGRLTSIDPNQTSEWQGVGVANVARSGLAHRHEMVEDFDYLALPRLLERGQRVQFGYIDGWHTFDYVALDHFYVDKMLDVGGVMGFNDCGHFAVHRAIQLLTANRRYEEMDVGLPVDYRARNAALSLARRVLRRSQADRYFMKAEQFEPGWHFYKRF